MKFSRIIAAAAAFTMLSAVVSCSEKKDYSTSDVSSVTNDPVFEAPAKLPTEPIIAAADGPRLSIKDTTAAPGETAEVTVVVENAERKWSICGFHITYPDILKPEMLNDEERLVMKKAGSASEYAVGSVCMEWRENKADYLVDNNLGAVFFCESFEGNYGLNGDVVTIFLKIPDDAVSGTEYPVDFFYIDGDLFHDMDEDLAAQQYTFENWKGGKITVT